MIIYNIIYIINANTNYFIVTYAVLVCVGGAFVSVQDTASPFGYKRGEGIDAGKGETNWVVAKDRQKYDSVFTTLEKSDGKLSGAGI